jgi:GT2 family glycosyltransferase
MPSLVRDPIDVNIVIVVYQNAEHEIRTLVSALLSGARQLGWEARASVVLNDDSQYASDADVRVFSGHGNVGFARGVSIGATGHKSQHTLIVNPDCVVDPDTVTKFLRAMAESTGLVVPLLEKAPGVIDVAIYESWVFTPTRQLSRVVSSRFLRRSRSTKLPRLMKAPGTFIGMPSRVVDELNRPFDESFYLYGEDRDLSFRARKKGLTIDLVREARVLHPGGGSTEGMREIVDRGKADGMLRVAFRKYGRIGLLAMMLNVMAESIVKDALRGTSLTPSRRWTIRRWRESWPGPAPALTSNELARIAATKHVLKDLK